jgi:hypothetical protein
MGRNRMRRRRVVVTGLTIIGLLALLAVAPAGAGAFAISSFSVQPSTTQAAGHPDVRVSLDFSTASGEDVRDLTLDFPPGLIGNPETKTKCSQATFSRDGCTTASRVGNANVVATALGLPLSVFGTVYVLRPSPTDAATLGVVLRPTAGLPIVGNIYAKAHISVQRTGDGDYFLRNTITNLPRTATAVLGLIPVPITLQRMNLNLNRFGNTPGTFFLTNPTSCQAATSNVQAVSYSNQTAAAQSSYTPVNCEAVPFNPSMGFTTTSTQAGSRTGATATLSVPASEQPVRQSHVKSVLLKFPPGLTLDILGAFGVTPCSDADLAADTCPAFSDIGDAVTGIPPLPPDFTGDVYRIAPPPGQAYGFGVVLRGPRGVKATLRGGASITSIQTPEGFLIQLTSSFPSLPQIPFTSFRLAITLPMFFNSPTCGTRDAEAVLGGWSGAGANLTAPYTTTGC